MTQQNKSGRWTRKEIRESRCFAQSREAKIRHDNTVFYSADKLRDIIIKLKEKYKFVHTATMFANDLTKELSLSKSEEERK